MSKRSKENSNSDMIPITHPIATAIQLKLFGQAVDIFEKLDKEGKLPPPTYVNGHPMRTTM